MNKFHQSEPVRCFMVIAVITTVVVVIDLVARAFFYEQAQRFSPYLALPIGSITLCILGVSKRRRDTTAARESQTNTAGIRRVRVTGPVK